MAADPIKIKLVPNGPIRFENGKFEITLSDGSTLEQEAPFSFCRCGESSQKPFCDGTHKTCGFEG